MRKGDWLAIALVFRFRRARFFGTHARARNAGAKHARDPSAVLARLIALASDPVARADHGLASRARKGDREE